MYDSVSAATKAEAVRVLQELAPTLNAFGLNKHFYWRDPAVQKIFDEAGA